MKREALRSRKTSVAAHGGTIGVKGSGVLDFCPDGAAYRGISGAVYCQLEQPDFSRAGIQFQDALLNVVAHAA